jgi:hypothetical protein
MCINMISNPYNFLKKLYNFEIKHEKFEKNHIKATFDALPSHGVKPTWGSHKVKLRKVETWRHAPGFQL